MQITRPQIEEDLIAIDGLRLRIDGDGWLPERFARACEQASGTGVGEEPVFQGDFR